MTDYYIIVMTFVKFISFIPAAQALALQNGHFFYQEVMSLNQSVNKFRNYLVLRSESPSDKVTPFMGCTDGRLTPLSTEHYRHSATKASATFRNVRRKSNFEVRTMYVSGPGSSVDIVTDYGLDGPGSIPGGDEIFRLSKSALWPTQPPVQWVPGVSRGWRRPGRGADPPTPPSAEGPRK